MKSARYRSIMGNEPLALERHPRNPKGTQETMLAAAKKTSTNQVRLDARLLAEVVDLIIAAVPTVAIYLFGSHARGEASETSDIDLYVVTRDEKKTPIRYAAEARSAVFDRIYREGYDFDLIARSQNAFESARQKHSSVEYHVAQDGIKLYG